MTQPLDDILHILSGILYDNVHTYCTYDRSRSLDHRPSDPTDLQVQKISLCTIEQSATRCRNVIILES